MQPQYSPKNNPRVIIIQKLYGKYFNQGGEITFPRHRFKKFIKDVVKGTIEREEVIVDEISNNLSLASRNLPNVNVTNLNTLNPINLLKFNSVVIVENCLNLIEEKLS